MKIEDYSGSAEISLFGDNYINYFKYSSVGNAIRIKYQYQSSRYDKSKTFLTILDVQLLESIKGQVINGIQLNLKERDINDNSLTALLDRYIGNNSEDSRNLFINIAEFSICFKKTDQSLFMEEVCLVSHLLYNRKQTAI